MANSWSDSISEIDTATLALVRTLPAGFRPNSVITDLAARFLYVANRVSNDISVIDLKSGTELKRLAAGRGASYLERSPDGASIYCTHIYPYPGNSARRQNPTSPLSTPPARPCASATLCPMRPESSASPCRPTAAWEWPRNFVPRT